MLEDWQERLIEEREELEIKLAKLTQHLGKFKDIYNECTPVERYCGEIPNSKELLFRQQRVMLEYHQVLTQRICLFKKG